MHTDTLKLQISGRGFNEITTQVARVVRNANVVTGMCHLWIRHTSASLIVCENADPDVLVDLEGWMSRMVRDGDRQFVHTAEGPDDMPAHIRSVLTATSLSVPVVNGRLDLGTWQGLFVWEHRHHPQARFVRIMVDGLTHTV